MKTIMIGLIAVVSVCRCLYAAEVNVYSARKEALIKPLFDQFTEATGITVNLVTGKADPLLKRLEFEGAQSPADILLTVDVTRLSRGKVMGLFQTVDSAVLTATIPAAYRDPDNQWFGLSLRSRVIVYAKDRVNASELGSYLALADEKWRQRICVRSSSNVYNQSLVAAMIKHHGKAKTTAWAKALVNNFARQPKGGDRDQIKAVAAGVCDIALVNNYYLAGMLESSQADARAAASQVQLFWPNQHGSGAHINVSGAALLRASKNRAPAIQLLEFMVSDKAQRWYTDKNYEYSINPAIKTQSILSQFGDFNADALALQSLAEHQVAAVLLMDEVGWR